MSSIDERVVGMKFDNSQFQKGVSDTNKSLDDLKKGLNLDGAAKSLQGLDAAGKNFSLAGMTSGIEAVASKFSALSILGITALVNIGNQAVNTGINLVKSLTVGPIADGFSDYNAKLGSVQTIMNATGADIGTVSGYFGELDTYADKTIYNLGDMTGAFAKFTNAGVDMDKSVPAIKGIANMVALAGQDAGAASIAMYNMSQSIAGGFLTTTDYKSLNLANVATKEWKGQMVDAAVAAGTLKKTGDGLYEFKGAKKAASEAELFNEHLAEGWATTDVLMGVLGDYGNTETEIGKKAQAAAQDVKSFGMMMETLKAGVGTGWTDTFEIVVGNLHEAKALFTPLTETIGGFLSGMGEARNKILGEWKELGGRTAVIDTVKSAFQSLIDIIKPIKEAFREIFPPMTGQTLMTMTEHLKAFVETLKPSEKTIANVKRTFKGVFAILDTGWLIIQKLWGVFQRLFNSMDGAGGGLLEITANIGDFFVKLRETLLNSEKFNNFFIKLGDILVGAVGAVKDFSKWLGEMAAKFQLQDKINGAISHLKDFGKWLGQIGDKVVAFFQNFKGIDTSGFTGAVDNFKNSFQPLKGLGDNLSKFWGGLVDIFQKALDIGKTLATKLGEAFRGMGSGAAEGIGQAFNVDTILGILGTGMLGGIVVLVKKIYDKIKEGTGGAGGGFLDSIKTAFGALTDTLSQMQATLKASTLLLIAAAIALLTISVVALSKIDPEKLLAALAAMTVMFVQLSAAMAVFAKISAGSSMVKLVLMGVALILVATAIRILAGAVAELAKNDWEQLSKGLLGVIALLGGLAGAMRLMPKNPTGMIATGIGMIALAVAIKILASAVGDFAGMNWEKMMQGLIGVGIVLGGLALFTQLAKVNKGAVAQSAGLILLGVALKIIASAVLDFANMDPTKIQQGLGALTAVLGILAVFTRVVNPTGMLSTATAMVILGGALKILVTVLEDIGNIPFEVLKQGLGGMGAALVIIGIAMQMMPSNMLITAAALVVVGLALKIIVSALKDMGGMSWEEIGKSMVVLAGSLIILAGAMYIMSGAIVGALAMIIVAGALALMAPVLIAFGKMSWDEIGRGLTMLAASLAIIALGSLLLIPAVPILIGLGIAVTLLGVGMALAGVGILAFSAGLLALSVAGGVGTGVLVAMVMALIGLIPYAMEQLGIGILKFAEVIATGGPAITAALVTVLMSLIDSINIIAPLIIDCLWNLVTLLVNKLVEGIPFLVDAGMKLLIGILKGIGDNIGQVVDSATDIIVNFLNGIANNLPRIIDAGTNIILKFLEGIRNNFGKLTDAAGETIVSFVDSLTKSIETNSEKMREAAGKLAFAIIDGMTGGLASKAQDVWNSAVNIGNDAINGIKNAIESKSPSKKSTKLGRFTTEGFALGISSLSGMVAKAASGVGDTAISELKKSLTGVGSEFPSDLDMNPTIRPVLDLSDVKDKSRLIGGMITPPSLTVEGSYAKAATLSIAARANQETVTTDKGEVVSSSGDKITFIQNNTSPKAISPADTYRNTKNQISMAKGALRK
jgi:hypothetical protein